MGRLERFELEEHVAAAGLRQPGRQSQRRPQNTAFDPRRRGLYFRERQRVAPASVRIWARFAANALLAITSSMPASRAAMIIRVSTWETKPVVRIPWRSGSAFSAATVLT